MTNKKYKIINQPFTHDELKFFNYTLIDLVLFLKHSPLPTVEFAAQHCLIKNERVCDFCLLPMKLYVRSSTVDKIQWECKKTCKVCVSIRRDSIFEGSHLKLENCILLLYFWCKQTPQDVTSKELKINKNTVLEWYKKFREIVEILIEEENGILGGIDEEGNQIDVEIDEYSFMKRKYNRGRVGDPQWMFGAVERLSGRCFFVPVEARNSSTLLPIIYERIAKGTRIISDCWAAYEHYPTIIYIYTKQLITPYISFHLVILLSIHKKLSVYGRI